MATAAITHIPSAQRGDMVSVEEIKWVRNQIQQLLRDVMVEGIDNDYAIIPGTKKQSLLKPGAEKICSMFRFSVRPVVEEFRDGDDVTYRVSVSLFSPSDILLGIGVGECSTKETKYAWREAVCAEEWECADISMRRQHWKKGYNGGDPVMTLQVRESPTDKANTVLKMAKKRGLIDAVLTVTACSDIFTQDIEEDGHDDGGRKTTSPQSGKSSPTGTSQKSTTDQGPIISQAQAGRFYGIWKNAGRKPEDIKSYLLAKCGVDDSRKMPVKFYDEACRWAGTNEPVPAKEQAADSTSSEEKEARAAADILNWDSKTLQRFVDQYAGDWKKILSELNILVNKREGGNS